MTTSSLGLRNGELGLPWPQLEYPPKAYTAMAIPATTATMGSGGSLAGLWAGDGSGLAAHIASAMPTPPESPPPGRLAAAQEEGSHVRHMFVTRCLT